MGCSGNINVFMRTLFCYISHNFVFFDVVFLSFSRPGVKFSLSQGDYNPFLENFTRDCLLFF